MPTLAKRRLLRVGDQFAIKTPLLLPSFSSKGFPAVKKILKTMEEYITDEVLISAYDLHFKWIEPPFDFASLIYLDSGGYEASKDTELSETNEREHIPKEWDVDTHQKIVESWTSLSPTIFVTYDHPKHRLKVEDQISRGKRLKIPEGHYARALLLKPESEESIRLKIDAIVPHVQRMNGFSVIGVTEKEIGNSVFSRMLNIAKLRMALDAHHLDTPIHVFGSLDTISTYLYFLSGADIFDGLTWLRYAFLDGDTIYRHSFGMLNLPITTKSDIVEGRCWSNNYQYMQEMKLKMNKFTQGGDFAHFGKHATMIKDAYESMMAELVGG